MNIIHKHTYCIHYVKLQNVRIYYEGFIRIFKIIINTFLINITKQTLYIENKQNYVHENIICR